MAIDDHGTILVAAVEAAAAMSAVPIAALFKVAAA
jgi:hypothetical protein